VTFDTFAAIVAELLAPIAIGAGAGALVIIAIVSAVAFFYELFDL
jgi:hypothetical protein